MDLDGDGVSTWGDVYVFNYWLELGGRLADAVENARFGGEVLDLSDFFSSPAAALSANALLASAKPEPAKASFADFGAIEGAGTRGPCSTDAELDDSYAVVGAEQVHVLYCDYDLFYRVAGQAQVGSSIYIARQVDDQDTGSGITKAAGFDAPGYGSAPLSEDDVTDFFNGDDAEVYTITELAGDTTRTTKTLLATLYADGRVIRFEDLSDSSDNCYELAADAVDNADGLALITDDVPAAFGSTGQYFASSNVAYQSGMGPYGEVYRDNNVSLSCNSANPGRLFYGLDYCPALALGNFAGAGTYRLYYSERTQTSPITRWGVRYRVPTAWGTEGNLSQYLSTQRIDSLVFDPYSESLFAGTTSKLYRIKPNGTADEFLTGLNYSGGGMTFTHSGILVVSEEENLLAVDGWRYEFKRGDANGNLDVDISDVRFISGWLFTGSGESGCWDAADADDNSKIELTDSVYLANALFNGGPQPPPPYDDFGVDPTADLLGCRAYDASKEISW